MKAKNLTGAVQTLVQHGARSSGKLVFKAGEELPVSESLADEMESDNRVRESRGQKPYWKITRPAKIAPASAKKEAR